MEAKNAVTGSTRTTKTRGFPPLSHNRFGFVCTSIYTPNRTGNILLGARHAHSEVFVHEACPPERVEGKWCGRRLSIWVYRNFHAINHCNYKLIFFMKSASYDA